MTDSSDPDCVAVLPNVGIHYCVNRQSNNNDRAVFTAVSRASSDSK